MKNIILLLCLAILMTIGACKKENKTPSPIVVPYDFRDSLIGSYNCTNHEVNIIIPQYSSGSVMQTDSIIGNGIVTVTKYSGDDSSIVANGAKFEFSLGDGITMTYGFKNSNLGIRFYNHGESVNFIYTYYLGSNTIEYFYDAGTKQ